MKKTALITIALVGLTLMVLFYPKSSVNRDLPDYNLVVSFGDTGCYYEIFYGNQLLIKQTTIPAVSGAQHFHSEEDAEQIGNLVVQKLHDKMPPAITKDDLDSLGIRYQAGP